MQLNPAEISELIKSRIEGLSASADIRNQGTVVSVTDGIVRIHGLSDVMQGEMLEFPATADGTPTFGLALNLERDSVGAVISGRVRTHFRRRYRQVHRPHSGSAGRSRTDWPRGQRAGPADRRQGPDQRQDDRRDRKGRAGRDRTQVGGPAGADRPEVDRLDGAVGRGQRELIIGDRQTGKTAVAIDAIINQKGQNMTCVYVAIGQKASSIKPTWCARWNSRRDGLHHRRRRVGLRIGGHAVRVTLFGLHDGRILPRSRPRRADRVRRPVQAGLWPTVRCRCCCAVRRAAKPTPATCSTCTAVCWSALPA
jgi:hypothetical protein